MVHIDLYRIGDPEEAVQLGLEEYFEGPGITVVEWADRAAKVLPPRSWWVTLLHGEDPHQRTLTVREGGGP
jgi:tRNA threonylcarbamoyladenosine biosynthesis protein TsaE